MIAFLQSPLPHLQACRSNCHWCIGVGVRVREGCSAGPDGQVLAPAGVVPDEERRPPPPATTAPDGRRGGGLDASGLCRGCVPGQAPPIWEGPQTCWASGPKEWMTPISNLTQAVQKTLLCSEHLPQNTNDNSKKNFRPEGRSNSHGTKSTTSPGRRPQIQFKQEKKRLLSFLPTSFAFPNLHRQLRLAVQRGRAGEVQIPNVRRQRHHWGHVGHAGAAGRLRRVRCNEKYE
jgi:hypothetical protein